MSIPKKSKLTIPNVNLPRQAIEKLGKKLAKFTQKNHNFQSFAQSQSYQSLDLSQFNPVFNQDFNTNKNTFHEHIPKLSKRVFGGTKFNDLGRLASKVIAPTTLEKISDTTFLQIGKLAQSWADRDLRHDSRFKGNAALDITECHALAQAIADQNRALVVVGSVSNLAGLVGILGDTVWLLTVALRSIFQIATIYDKPLTGKAGIQIAYELLAKADLSKLQEKQTLMAGIGVVEAIADNHVESEKDHQPKTGDYKKFTKFADDTATDQTSMLANVMGYVQQVESLATQLNINLHSLSLGKFNKVLPIAAVGIGASYNNVIIDEILSVAIATFAPVPKTVVLEKKENQNRLRLAL